MEKFHNTHVSIYAISDRGYKRKNNEDAAYCGKSQYGVLLVLADGMGGHRKGEVASKLVIDSLSLPFAALRKTLSLRAAKSFLAKHSKSANKEIYDMAISSEEYNEMGTTEVACLLTNQGVQVLSVGDSRLYTYSTSTGLKQITKDQTYVEMLLETGRISKSQMKNHPQRNILTNAVGLNASLTNWEEYTIKEEDYQILLLCSDGLYNMVSDEEIAAILATEKNVEDRAKSLIQAALDKGGIDNIAVVLLEK